MSRLSAEEFRERCEALADGANLLDAVEDLGVVHSSQCSGTDCLLTIENPGGLFPDACEISYGGDVMTINGSRFVFGDQ